MKLKKIGHRFRFEMWSFQTIFVVLSQFTLPSQLPAQLKIMKKRTTLLDILPGPKHPSETKIDLEKFNGFNEN